LYLPTIFELCNHYYGDPDHKENETGEISGKHEKKKSYVIAADNLKTRNQWGEQVWMGGYRKMSFKEVLTEDAY
jgi:hypothetical protein